MWNQKESPLRIEKRFEFEEYSKISKFMENIDQLCEKKNIYPNITFGKNFVSITIFLENQEISQSETNFTNQIDEFFLKLK